MPNVEIIPNPFTDRTRIVIQNVLLTENAIFRVYNHLGQVIETNMVNSNEFEFQRKGLPEGLYNFDISNNGKIIARGKLMIQ